MAIVPEEELIDAFEMDVSNHKVFSQLWLRASQIKSYLSEQINKLPGDHSQAEIDEYLARLVSSILQKCETLQKLNLPFIIQN